MTSILLCLLGTLLLRLGNSATGVLMGLVLASMDRQGAHISANTVGLLAAAFYLTELLGAPWFGAQSDRYGRRPFLIAGPLFGAAAIQLIGWPGLVLAMAVGRAIEGLSTASSAPATLSFLGAQTALTPATRARVMAWYEMATVVGIAGGFVAGGLLWDLLGNGAFVAVTGIYAASLGCFWPVRDPKVPGGEAREHLALLAALRRPRVLRFVPAWLLINTVVGAWFIHSTFQLTGAQRPGQYLPGAMGGAGLSAGFILFAVAFVAGIALWGAIMGARRRTTIMLLTLPGVYGICGTLLALNHLTNGDMGRVGVFTGLFLLAVMLASGFTPAALTYLADLTEEAPHLRGAIMGLYSVMLGLGQLLGGALGGPFAEVGAIDGLILFTGLLATGALGAVLLLRKWEAREAIRQTAD